MSRSPREQAFRDAIAGYADEGPEALLAHGHRGVRDALRERLDSTSIAVEIEDLVERGDHMLVLFRLTAVGAGSGAEAVSRPAAVQSYDGELVCHVRFILDRERAREAFDAA